MAGMHCLECFICSTKFMGRPEAKTCSSRCRQILYRMRQTPIEETLILDLTDKAGIPALDKVLDKMRNCDDPDPHSENSMKLDDEFFAALRNMSLNNPAKRQPAKYQRKAKSLK